jgi:hypothetical protein
MTDPSSRRQKHPQNKPGDQTAKVKPDTFASRADSGADSVPTKPQARARSVNDMGDTYKDDDAIHPKDRRQVR